MTCTIKNIRYAKDSGTLYITIEFISSNIYKCFMSVDEIIILSDSPIIMNWNTEYDNIRWKKIKEECEWCEEHFIELRALYNE